MANADHLNRLVRAPRARAATRHSPTPRRYALPDGLVGGSRIGHSACVANDALVRAIDGLYDTFARYERPATFLACGCCWEGRVVPGARWKNTQRPLVEVDAPGGESALRTVPASALTDVALDVPVTGGSIDLFKHYLPRLFEIVAVEADPNDWDIEIVVGHLSVSVERGGDAWWNWPDTEQAAVDQYLRGLWEVRRRGTSNEADYTLCAIGLVVPDIQPYLDAWSNDQQQWAIDNLATFAADNAAALTGADLRNPFWTDKRQPAQSNRVRVVQWLRDLPSLSST